MRNFDIFFDVKQSVEQTVELSVFWNYMTPIVWNVVSTVDHGFRADIDADV